MSSIKCPAPQDDENWKLQLAHIWRIHVLQSIVVSKEKAFAWSTYSRKRCSIFRYGKHTWLKLHAVHTLNGVPMSITEVMLMWWCVLCRYGPFAIVNTELQNTIHHLQQQEVPPAVHWQQDSGSLARTDIQLYVNHNTHPETGIWKWKHWKSQHMDLVEKYNVIIILFQC